MPVSTDGGSVGREDRVRRVLRVLAESGHALPAAVIFRNAKLQGADFERRATTNYLRELHDRGLVIKVDPEALDSGDVDSIPLSDEGYFMATDASRDELGID